MTEPRPAVSLVVPFTGSENDLDGLVRRLSVVAHRPGDELIIADNRPGAQPMELAGGLRVHPASAVASAGFARNRGAAAAGGEWLVFIDADTEPAPDLLDAYFQPPPDPATAVLAGAIEDVAEGDAPSLVARHAVARGQMSQRVTMERDAYAYAQSANIAVRRDAFVEIHGFEEHIRAAEDADLCFRLADAGHGLESRPGAVVRHRARPGLAAALSQLAHHGSGSAWCERRHPGSFPRPGVDELIARFAGSLMRSLRRAWAGDRDGAGFALLEVIETAAFELGRLAPNRPRWRLRP